MQICGLLEERRQLSSAFLELLLADLLTDVLEGLVWYAFVWSDLIW